jgi:hypothetical protein
VRPMDPKHAIRMALWIVPLLLQLTIAAVMLRRSLFREFPLFFLYTLFVPLRDSVLLFAQADLNPWIYWVGEGVAVLLGMAVMYEMLSHMIQPYPFLRRAAVWLFQAAAIVGGLIGLLMLSQEVQFWRPGQPIETIVLLERSLRLVQVCLSLAVALFLSRFGLTWNHYVVGVVTGFGVAAGLGMVLLEFRAAHYISDSLFVLMSPLAHNCAVILWAVYFVPSRQREFAIDRVPTGGLGKWNQALQEFIGNR